MKSNLTEDGRRRGLTPLWLFRPTALGYGKVTHSFKANLQKQELTQTACLVVLELSDVHLSQQFPTHPQEGGVWESSGKAAVATSLENASGVVLVEKVAAPSI